MQATALFISEEDFDKTSAGVDIEMRLRRVFNGHCRNGEMDSNKFVRLCRECGLTDRFFTVIDVELCFLKVQLVLTCSLQMMGKPTIAELVNDV